MDPIMQQGTIPSPEHDDEGKMAKADLYKTARYALKLFKMMEDNAQLDGWVQAKITKAADYMASVYHYLEYEMKFSEYGQKLEMSDMYTPEEKKILGHKLMEAKEKMKALKKAQALKMKKKDEKVEEATGHRAGKGVGTAEKKAAASTKKQYSVKLVHKDGSKTKNAHYDADEGESEGDVRDRAGRDHKSTGYSVDSIRQKTSEATGHRAGKGVGTAEKKAAASTKSQYSVKLMHKDGAKTKNVHYDADEGESEGDVRDRAGRDHKSTGYSVDSIRKKTSESKKAKKDYDGDGKVETPKDEVWGSRAKAAAKSGKPFKEAAKPDYIDLDKDGNKKEPMKKAAKDKKVSEAAKCNHSPKGKSCPVHGIKECGSMSEASHQAKTTMKHVKNPTAGEKKAAKDIKPGVKGYSDRAAMLKSAEKDGRLKS